MIRVVAVATMPRVLQRMMVPGSFHGRLKACGAFSLCLQDPFEQQAEVFVHLLEGRQREVHRFILTPG